MFVRCLFAQAVLGRNKRCDERWSESDLRRQVGKREPLSGCPRTEAVRARERL